MFFDFGRSEGFPTIYDSIHTAVTVDVLDAGFILVAVILAVSFFISIITTRTDENIYLYLRVTVSIIIGIIILLGNFGQEWEIGHVTTRTPYKAGSSAEINASIGLKIGLRSVNVTLRSVSDHRAVLKTEKIDYNERFHWTWDQGRFGFGPYAGLLQREFREAQYRGAPLPILWVVDYFVIDGEGFRHGRYYRTAGWYSHIAMWSAFPCWLLANILFRSVIRYGGYLLGAAGCLQFTANLLWLVIRNPNPLVIPFEEDLIVTNFGPTYWLTFCGGIICVALCIAISVCERFYSDQLHVFFGIDPIVNLDQKYITEEEFEEEYQFLQPNPASQNRPGDVMPLIELRGGGAPGGGRKEKRKSLMVHVRRHTRSVIKVSQQHDDGIYGNLETYREEITRPSTQANDNEPEPEYGNIQTIQSPPVPPTNSKPRNVPPLPPKRTT